MEYVLEAEDRAAAMRQLNDLYLHRFPRWLRRYFLKHFGSQQSTELNSAIHRQFREAHAGHKPHAGLDPSRASTGVVWTSERAAERGYYDHPDEWANLGQGAPEVGDGESEINLTLLLSSPAHPLIPCMLLDMHDNAS